MAKLDLGAWLSIGTMAFSLAIGGYYPAAAVDLLVSSNHLPPANISRV